MEFRTARAVRIGGAVVVLVVMAPFLIPANWFRPTIEQGASAALGRRVSLGGLRISPLRQSFSAETLAVADDPAFSASPFFTAKTVTIGVELWPLIVSRSLNVTNIRIEWAVVTLFRNAAGRWNYASLATSSNTSSAFAIKKLELRDGRVLVGTAAQRRAYDHVHVTASDVSLGSRWPIVADAVWPGGGTFSLTGDVGPIDHADATRTPLNAMVTIDGLNLAKTGSLTPSARGQFDLKATIASKSGVAGVVGHARLSQALLVAGGSPASRPVAVLFDVRHDLHTHTGTLNPSVLTMGGASARLAGTYDARGEATAVNIKVDGGRMSAPELEAFLPALGIHLPGGAHLAAGTIAANLNVAGAMGGLVAAGNVGLYEATLTGFDLGSKMRAISAFPELHTGSDINIESMTTNVRVAADGLQFDRFNGDVASFGHITGAGTIDAQNNLRFGMVATLANPTLPGNERMPFLVEGTTSDPEFVADLSGVALRMLQGRLRAPALPR